MKTKMPHENELWRQLKSQVMAEYKTRTQNGSGRLEIYGKLLIIGSVACAAYLAILWIPPSPLWFFLWAALGVCVFFLIVNGAHDASHGVLFRSKLANEFFLLLSFGLFGIDGLLWKLRHITAHHPHANVSAVDPDSVPNPYLRLSPHHEWKPWFRFQHFYATLLYPFAFLHTALIQDFEHLFISNLPYVDRIVSRPKTFVRMVCVKGACAILFLVIPSCFLHVPLTYALLGLFLELAVASLVFVLSIALNHYVIETTFFANIEESKKRDFLSYQLIACNDWNATSRFWCALMGGANAHTAHHLFPFMNHTHCYWVSQIISDFCREHSLTYHNNSFRHGLRSHFQFLKRLSLPNDGGIAV